uniref:Cytochrome c oxidase subunit NDUFA4 n=2 Tax=Xiphophorus maculatus TaxID=8083 RepID=M4AV65_XIPMA
QTPVAVAKRPSTMSMFSVVRKQMKSHPSLIPLFIFIGGGATMSMLYLARLALKNPDVSWDRTNNPEPWNKLGPNQQYKFFSVNTDYSKLKKDRPDF